MVNMKNLKTLKYDTFSKKKRVLSIICSRCGRKDENIFKEEESVEISKILDLIINIAEHQNKYDCGKNEPRIYIKRKRWKKKLFH